MIIYFLPILLIIINIKTYKTQHLFVIGLLLIQLRFD